MRQNNIRKKVAICGANGFIGENFCKLFSEKYDLVGLIRKRNSDKGNENNTKIETRIVDYENVNTLIDALEGVSVVIHLIGTAIQTPTETYQKTTLDVTKNILDACKKQNIPKFIYFSGLGTRKNNTNGYFISRFLVEQMIQKSKLNYTIFRPSYIIGKHDLFTIRLIREMKQGMVRIYGSGNYRIQPIYVNDVTKMLDKIIQTNESEGIFDLVGPKEMSFLDYLDMLDIHVKLKYKKEFINIEKAFQDIMQSDNPLLSVDSLIIRICDEVADHKRLEKEFGFKLTYPKEALEKSFI